MDDVLIDTESIIKFEEVKEEPNNCLVESPWTVHNEVHLSLPLPLLEPKEEVTELKQEQEYEVHLPLPLPLLEPKEEVTEIKQEQEEELQPLTAVFIPCDSDEIPCDSDEIEAEGELPKYVDGMFAVCHHCGYTSLDFNRCERCKKKLPEAVKSIPKQREVKKVIEEDEVQLPVSEPTSPTSTSTPIPLLEPKEEVVEIKQEEEEELEPLAAVFIPCDTNEIEIEEEPPKYVDDMLAVCHYCGYTSLDFNRCERCKRKLPETVKSIPKLTAKKEVIHELQKDSMSLRPRDRVSYVSKKWKSEESLTSSSENTSSDSWFQEENSLSSSDGVLPLENGDASPGKVSSVKSGRSSDNDNQEEEGLAEEEKRMASRHWALSVREKVVTLVTSRGCSVSEVGRRFGIGSRTAQKWVRRWRQTGDVRRRVGTGLGGRVSSTDEDAVLLTAARSNPWLRSSHLHHVLGFPGKPATVQNRLRAAGLVERGFDWYPRLMDAQRVDRMAFALANAARDWGDVVFSGACVFSAAEDGPVRVFRPQMTQHNAGYVPEPEGRGRASVACWGWVSARGVGVLHRIEPGPLAAQYLHVLQNVMLPSVRLLYPEGPFHFQQDQLRVHKTDFVQEWLASQQQFELLDWPPASADLNPIEDVWAETKQAMTDNWPSPQPKTCDALWELVSDAWDEVASSEDFAEGLVRFVPERLEQVVKNDGLWAIS